MKPKRKGIIGVALSAKLGEAAKKALKEHAYSTSTPKKVKNDEAVVYTKEHDSIGSKKAKGKSVVPKKPGSAGYTKEYKAK